jgi:uncharacterized membrane protein YesL
MSVDGKLYAAMELLARMVLLNLIFLLFAPFFVTTGVLISGMMYIYDDPNRPIKACFGFMYRNSIKSLPLTIFFMASLSTSYYLIMGARGDAVQVIVAAIAAALLIGYNLMMLYLFAKYDMPLRRYFQSGFYLLLQNALVVLLLVFAGAAITFLVLTQSAALFIMFAVSIDLYLFVRMNKTKVQRLYALSTGAAED